MSKRKPDVSLAATEKEREAVVRRIRKVQRLLRQYDVEANMFDPGVRGYVIGDGRARVDLDGDTWAWLEPLLKELVKWREYGKTWGVCMSKAERKKYETVRKRS